jgi:hypothetical protein
MHAANEGPPIRSRGFLESSMARRIDPVVFFGDPSIHADDPEPSLDDLLRDPMFQGLMRSDGVTRADLLTLVTATRRRLRRTMGKCCAA